MIHVNAMGDACPIPVVKTKNAIRELNEQDAALVLAMIQRLSLPLRESGAEQ